MGTFCSGPGLQSFSEVSESRYDLGLYVSSGSIVITGFIGGREFDLGSVKIRIGDTLLDGWDTMALHVAEEAASKMLERIIVIAYGVAANSNEVLYDYDMQRTVVAFSQNLETIPRFEGRITNYSRWGSLPTLVEGLDLEITLRTKGSVQAWSLDNVGFKHRELPITSTSEEVTLKLSHVYRTIWYEVLVKAS